MPARDAFISSPGALLSSGDGPVPSVSLALNEAVALCTAWSQQAARARSIRLLVLKGSALTRQGLREPHSSSDVDLLIEPACVLDFIDCLLAAGWTEFPDTFASKKFVLHSRTFRREGWPNSIDVHAFWPGFLSPAGDVFETLWARRVSVEFGHLECDVPDRLANLLMLALHSMRGTAREARHARELQGVLEMTLTPEERTQTALLAVETGCRVPLREVLPRMGVPVEVTHEELRSVQYLEWHRKVAHAQGRTASWLLELRHAAWRRKPLILRHGVWPTDRDLLAEHAEVSDRFTAKVWARIMRLIRGLGQLPRVIPALRRR
jgi:hypothetical protein